MHLAKTIRGGMIWSCFKCGKDISKQKGDYTPTDRDREYGKKEAT
jgi:ribosomal protein L37AE/L43A